MKKKLKNIKILPVVSLLLSFLTSQSLAETTPGVTLTGMYGSVSSVYMDSLIPLPDQTGNSFFYLDPQGIFHNTDNYSASFGAGYRLLQDRWGILGANLFTDYNRSSSHSFWFISPGLERLGDNFDFSINAYVPVSRQSITTGQKFADDIGDTSSVTFSGHDQIDQLVDTFESTGLGADFTVGIRLPVLTNNTKFYVGAYYFSPKNNESILGGAGRLEIPVNRYLSFITSEAYDGVMHNTVKVGLSLALGSRSSGRNYQGQLKDRLVDPVQRHLVATSSGSMTAEPVEAGVRNSGDYAVERSNIWFFNPSGSSNTCTANSPCQLSQDKINSINSTNPKANLYVETGQYNLSNSGAKLTINAGQSLFGRAKGFTAAADFNALPTLYSSMELKGDNYIEHVKLLNDGSQAVGLKIDDSAANVTLNGINIGDSGLNPSQNFKTGIQLGNQDSVYIENSQINAFSHDDMGGLTAGVKLDGVSNNHLRIENSTITVSSDTVGDPVGVFVGNDQATQAYAQNNKITLNQDKIQVLGVENANSAFGVYLGNYFSKNDSSVDHNDLTIRDSQIDVKNNNNRSSFGVFLGNYQYSAPAFNNNNIQIDGSSISITSLANAYGIFEGMFNGANNLAVNNSLTVNNSEIDAVTQGADAYGVELEGYNSRFTLSNNVIQATAENNLDLVRSAYGVDLKADNDVLNMNGNQIISQAEGSNVLVVGFGEGLYFTDMANNNIVNASSNFIKASSDSNHASVNAVFIENSYDTINFDNDTIVATGSGRNSAIFGVNISGNNNTINISDSQIQVTATGLRSEAIGVVANSGNRYSASAFDNVISLSHNEISAISWLGKAEGISDKLSEQNNNDWIISQE